MHGAAAPPQWRWIVFYLGTAISAGISSRRFICGRGPADPRLLFGLLFDQSPAEAEQSTIFIHHER